MIKLNLLESITDRPATVAFVEDKVSSTRTQTFLLALTVLALLVLGVGYDYVSANAQHVAATKELAKQRSINEQMNAVKREQADLEKKMADITSALTQSRNCGRLSRVRAVYLPKSRPALTASPDCI